MNFLKSKSKLFLCAIVAIVAILIRLAAYSFWLDSPFTEYHKISGLDMMTHMQFGLDFARGNANFSLHKLLCWTMIKLTGEDYPIEALIFAQYCLGALVPVMVLLISLRLSGNKILAIFAGLFTALYAPILMYESFSLVESLFLLCAITSLYFAIFAKAKNALSLFISGFFIILPSMVRFSGIFLSAGLFVWVLLRVARRKDSQKNINFFKPVAIFASGSFLAFMLVFLINYFNSGEISFFPGKPAMSYILKAGAEMKINPEDDIAAIGSIGDDNYATERKAASYLSKVLDLIRPYEIPNNLNYYFIRNQFPIMKFLLGPMFLIPLGLSGFIVALASPLRFRRYWVLFFYFATISAPLMVFIPLARYRVALLPFFAFFSAYYLVKIREYLRNSQNQPMSLLLSCLVYVIVLAWSAPSSLPLRSEDFIGYGEAMEHKKHNPEEILSAYIAGYNLAPQSQSAVLHLSNCLMGNGNFRDAKEILEKYCKDKNDEKAKLMLAAARLGCGEFLDAKKILESLHEPRSGRTRVNYFYQFAECYRLLGEAQEARKFYELAMQEAENDEQKNIIKAAIAKIKSSP